MRKTILSLLFLACSLPGISCPLPESGRRWTLPGPRSVVQGMYASWLGDSRSDFLESNAYKLEPSLLSKVSGAMALKKKTDGTFFDCDPLTGTQEKTSGFSLGIVRTIGRKSTVEVFLRGESRRLRGIKVELCQSGHGTWLVSDVVFNRRETLRKTCDELLTEAKRTRARGGRK